MISVDLHPSQNATAVARLYPADNHGPSIVTLSIDSGRGGVTIFGKSGDYARFAEIAKLLNEGFDAQRPEHPAHAPTPADLAGDYHIPF